MITRCQLSRSEKSSKINYVHSKLCTLSKYIPLFRDITQPAVFYQAKHSVVSTEFPMSSKFYFTLIIFIDKYLKFKEIEYFIYYIQFEIWQFFILCKFPLFSTVEHRVHQGINLPSKTHALFFDNPHLLNLQTAQAPLFGQFLYVLVFRETPSLKISFLANPHNINYLMKKNKFHLFHKVIRNFSS